MEKMRLFWDAAVSFWSSNVLSRAVHFSSLSSANLLQLISLNTINPLRFSITCALAEESCPLKTFYVNAKVFPNINSAGVKSAFSRKNNSVRAPRTLASRSSCPFYLHRRRNVIRIPCNVHRVSWERNADEWGHSPVFERWCCGNETRSNAQRHLSSIEAVVNMQTTVVLCIRFTYPCLDACVCVFAARTFQELYFIRAACVHLGNTAWT